VRPLAISLLLLAAGLGGCKRSNPEPQPPEPSSDASSDSSTAEGSALPEGCTSVDDCTTQGTLALLAGEARGLPMLDYACAEGSAGACQNLSTVLRSGQFPEDAAVAHVAAKRGCELGSPGACVDLGVDESMGLGGATQDFAAAKEHFNTACESGIAMGCRYIGVLYHEGTLGSPDPTEAMKWFTTACEMSDPESCFNAGALIINGLLGDVDLQAAAGFMTRGCELGDQDSCAAVEQIAAQTAKVPGANLRVGSATVDGLTVEGLECRVEGGGMGLLGNLALIGALAQRKAKIDACGKKGTVVEVTWTATGGKITKAEGEGSEAACVAKVLKKLSTPVDGECAVTIVIGS
jgi:TPR repeat protein